MLETGLAAPRVSPRHAREVAGDLSDDVHQVPLGYPTAVMYMDESGSKGSGSQFFVVGAVKTRRPGDLNRAIYAVRQKHGFTKEFKFSEVTNGALAVYCELIDTIAASDAHIGAFVIDKARYDPFPDVAVWRAQAQVFAQLVVGLTNRRELVSVLLDGVSTPAGVAVDELVRSNVNQRFKQTSVVSAVSLDSRCTDGLQAADFVASAIGYERHAWAGRTKQPPADRRTPKAKLARHLREAFDLDSFDDVRTDRVNILTSRVSTHTGALAKVGTAE